MQTKQESSLDFIGGSNTYSNQARQIAPVARLEGSAINRRERRGGHQIVSLRNQITGLRRLL